MFLELTDAAKNYIAEAGFDPAYGARPLKRALQKLVEDSLASRILEGAFVEGDRIMVDVGSDGKITFSKEAE